MMNTKKMIPKIFSQKKDLEKEKEVNKVKGEENSMENGQRKAKEVNKVEPIMSTVEVMNMMAVIMNILEMRTMIMKVQESSLSLLTITCVCNF